MNDKFTPGPWANDERSIYSVDEGGARFALIAKVAYAFGAGSKEREEANARLIAQAPNLLATVRELAAALESSLQYVRTGQYPAATLETITAALAHARATLEGL